MLAGRGRFNSVLACTVKAFFVFWGLASFKGLTFGAKGGLSIFEMPRGFWIGFTACFAVLFLKTAFVFADFVRIPGRDDGTGARRWSLD